MPLAEVERPGVVESAYMVHVIMGQQDGVEMPYARAERLDAEVGAAVDEQPRVVGLHKH